MFTLATAFLIFAQCSFRVISNTMRDFGLQALGADIYAEATMGLMNEGPMSRFLESQKEKGYVEEYGYSTASYETVADKSRVGGEVWIKDIDDYSSVGPI